MCHVRVVDWCREGGGGAMSDVALLPCRRHVKWRWGVWWTVVVAIDVAAS